MSTIKVDTITDEAGSGAPDFPNGLTGNGSSLTGLATAAQGALADTALQPNGDGSGLTGLSGGMTYDTLGTIATTSGSSVTLSGLDLTDYKQLLIVVDGVSAATSSQARILLNSFNFCQAFVTADSDAATGLGWVDLTSGVFSSNANTPWSSAPAGSQTGGGGQSGLSTSSTSITFTISVGTFDAGSIKIYGVA